ncbi:MAG: nucleotidyltransferase family protein [Phycisphaerales bacterium]|nr:nucleotidyltransferase family protein [Phycisphaerales bacterium]
MSLGTSSGADRLVVMARGLGTRMRKADPSVGVDDRQSQVADTGVKALIPIDRPFLDYVLSAAADSGFRRVCLIIGPEHTAVRNYYTSVVRQRLTIDFAIQDQPLGTANAVAAAETWAQGEAFVTINSDNFYPISALSALRTLPAPGAALFDRDSMLAGSNIPPDRIEKYAIAQIEDEHLSRIIEKPTPRQMQQTTCNGRLYLSMNLWLFDASIFTACRAIGKSARGEYEITDAVQYMIDKLGQRFAVARIDAPVLDLSSRTDIGPVTQKLRGTEVNL